MAKLVSKTYSEALFEVAIEEDKVDLFLDEMEFIVTTFKMYPQFYDLFKSPLLKIDEKKKSIEEVFGDKLSEEMLNFLRAILDKGRAYYIEPIKWEYEKLANNHKGIIKAVAVTAVALDEKDRIALENKLASITGKTIKLTNEIDDSLIGGVLVKLGDKVIDGSIKGKLEELKENLANVII